MPLHVSRIRAICFDVDGTLSDTDDVMVAQLFQVEGVVCGGEDAGMNCRVKRFHASVKDFRKSGELRDGGHGDTSFLQCLMCPAR